MPRQKKADENLRPIIVIRIIIGETFGSTSFTAGRQDQRDYIPRALAGRGREFAPMDRKTTFARRLIPSPNIMVGQPSKAKQGDQGRNRER